ncbi:MAG: hypothetical protein WCJ61_10620, partial [Paludibacter sp.]
SYNRSFGGGRTYPHGGSYTTTLRPDYTLSIWPSEITDEKVAENTEQITHIHFDAKYKVSNFYELITTSKAEELDNSENLLLIEEEEEENEKGTFKNPDLLKCMPTKMLFAEREVLMFCTLEQEKMSLLGVFMN